MNRALQVISIAGIAVSTASIAYYFVIFLPMHNLAVQTNVSTPSSDQAAALSEKIKCQKEGLQYFENEKKQNNDQKYGLHDPKFTYSEKLNTCLYLGGFTDLADQTVSEYIIDLNTNTTLSDYYGYPLDVRKLKAMANGTFIANANSAFIDKERELFPEVFPDVGATPNPS